MKIQFKQSYLLAARDWLMIVYLMAIVILFFIALMEFKLAFNVDYLPGIDLPIDEWYESTFH